jgi:hypothetical protein
MIERSQIFIDGKWADSSGHPPQDGFKLSDVGRERGRFGIEGLLEYKPVIG